MPPATPFSTAYLRFVPPVRAKCRRLLGSTSDADEIVQETFLRLWESDLDIEKGSEVRLVMAWLYRTCTRLSIDVLRKRRREGGSFLEAGACDELPCGAALEDRIVAKHLMLALSHHIPGEELEAAILCRVDGLSQPEAARVLEVSERTVRRILERFDERVAAWKKEQLS